MGSDQERAEVGSFPKMIDEIRNGGFDRMRELFEKGKVPAAWKEDAGISRKSS